MTTGKTIALIRQTFVGKLMSLLFNMLSRLVIMFLPRNKWDMYFGVIERLLLKGMSRGNPQGIVQCPEVRQYITKQRHHFADKGA